MTHPGLLLAASIDTGVNIADPSINPVAKFSNLSVILNLVIPLLSLGGALLFLAMLLYGAFVYMTAGGNAENVKKAQKIFMFSAIGLVLVVTAFILVKIVAVVFGLNDQVPL